MTGDPKRTRDPNQLAKMVVDIATGQVVDKSPTPEEQGKNPAAASLGQRGGKARANALTADQRSAIARKGASRRWAKTKAARDKATSS